MKKETTYSFVAWRIQKLGDCHAHPYIGFSYELKHAQWIVLGAASKNEALRRAMQVAEGLLKCSAEEIALYKSASYYDS